MGANERRSHSSVTLVLQCRTCTNALKAGACAGTYLSVIGDAMQTPTPQTIMQRTPAPTRRAPIRRRSRRRTSHRRQARRCSVEVRPAVVASARWPLRPAMLSVFLPTHSTA